MRQAADLRDFDVGGMVRLVSALRAQAAAAASVEEFAQRATELLHGTFIVDGRPQTALVRFYVTAGLASLPVADREYVSSRVSDEMRPDTTCLTLLGTTGTEGAWSDRRASANHRVIPLVAADQVATMPMIGGLLRQLGIDVAALAAGEPDVMLKSGDGSCRIFYVADAEGSPLIPAQEFVRQHAVASAIGFGGGLPTGEVFAVVMFCSVAVPLPTAELFETVALAGRLALLDMLELPLLHGSAGPRPALDERQLLQARADVSRALLEAHEQIAVAQADRLRATLQRAHYDAARANALSGVAASLTQVGSVQEVIEVLGRQGLSAVGADGLSVALVAESGEHVDVTVSAGFGEEVARTYARLPLDDALPTTYTARTGELVVLADIFGAAHRFPMMLDVGRAVGVAGVVSLPLTVRDRLIGALTCTWSRPQAFDGDDVRHMQALAAQAAQVIERWRVLSRERQHNETLQRSLLTPAARTPACEIAVRYLPAAELAQIGGDWHDSFLQRDGSIVVVIGDVVGHDTAAAAAMAQVRGLLRGIAWSSGMGPADILTALDDAMQQMSVDTTASCVVARLSQEAGGWRVTWSSAGHPPPILVASDSATRLLGDDDPDLVLGVDPTTPRHQSTVAFDQGSTLLLYTDGLVERRGQDFDDSVEDLRCTLITNAPGSLEQLCDHVLAQMPAGADDDVALLAVRLRHDSAPS